MGSRFYREHPVQVDGISNGKPGKNGHKHNRKIREMKKNTILNLPVTDVFNTCKLGIKIENTITGKLYELRRMTDPTTLEGTLYLRNREDHETIYEIGPEFVVYETNHNSSSNKAASKQKDPPRDKGKAKSKRTKK